MTFAVTRHIAHTLITSCGARVCSHLQFAYLSQIAVQITHRMICISQVEVATEHGLYKSACMHVNCVAALVFYRPYHMEVSDIFGVEFRHINKVSIERY